MTQTPEPNAGAGGAPPPPRRAPAAAADDFKHRPLGEILVRLGRITAKQLEEALAVKKKRGGAIGVVLVDLGYCEEADVSMALGLQAGMRRVDLDELDIPAEVIEKMDAMTARSYGVVPIEFAGGRLTVAMADPNNFRAIDELHMLLDYQIEGALADAQALVRALDKYYAEVQSVESVISEIDSAAEWIREGDADSVDLEDIRAMSESQPVKKLLNLVLLQAIRDKASDVHFEPFEDEFKMRYRIDGILYEMVPPPRHIAIAVVSRIKVMASLDIAERRLPQDGRIELSVGGKPVDLRVSVLPTMFGESVVMRVLDRTQVELDITKLGLREDEQRTLDDLIHLPNGIVIVTGPTGCGKTTTLYSALSAINDVETKIITTEDPVEYNLEGVNQIQVQPKIGMTFARCLRHILRHDPDVVMIGEIRDLETAEAAIQASLTGHLVFSTLHTNDAASAATRLLDMGVEPYLVTSTLEAAMAQRLVRTICSDCKEAYEPARQRLPADLELPAGEVLYRGAGCRKCRGTGYRGRVGIFELMELNDAIRQQIMSRAPTSNVLSAARRSGLRLLREDGWSKVRAGITTPEEVVRSTKA